MAHRSATCTGPNAASLAAITDQDEFGPGQAAAANPEGYVDDGAEEMAMLPPEELLATWREGRVALDAALRSVPDGEKIRGSARP